jgi:hypothetical protein
MGGNPQPRLRRQCEVVAAMKHVLEQDVKAGREQTLDTVCFMAMLLYITR